jgi:hypothetical protein
MKEKNEVVETANTPDTPNVVDVKIVFKEDGDYIVDNGVETGPLEITKDQLCYILPVNSANRKWFSLKKIEAAKTAGQTEIELAYKASRTIGSCAQRMPNEKLISYLPEAEQAEYKAIIERAMKARDDAKAKPMTELEKAQAKLAKAQAALAKLQAEAAEGNA